ncbi:MAG: hypothetical protein OXL97_14380 [Chloroflexota bacterium]|nr:hypothetical protein [Chloroflexota bacterium]MDE2884817.1 hypothetical protein [Chloroflexota bacterium]
MRPQPAIRIRTAVRRIFIATVAALLAALAVTTAGHPVFAQSGLTLVNHDRDFVERKKSGGFVARPVFDRQVDAIHYGIRHPETGDWIAPMYRVHSSGKAVEDGWEYSWSYPAVSEQPELSREEAFLLVIVAVHGGDAHTFNVVIPIYQPTSLWDRILAALDPGRWARAFAAWIVEAVHGALCGIVERISGADVCRKG